MGGGFIQLIFLSSSYLLLISATATATATDASGGTRRRNILQAKQNCPVNFESQDYAVITNGCKGPHYPAKDCCAAFKLFACPFSEQINDLSNNCASTMFSYINLAGKYPPGLFANECTEGKLGLACDDAQSPSSSPNNTGAGSPKTSPLLLLGVAFIGLLPLLDLF